MKKDAVAEPPIVEPDSSSNESVEHWEKILKDLGLGMNAGRPRRREVSFVGTSNDLVGIENEQAGRRVKGGRVVRPDGRGPD